MNRATGNVLPFVVPRVKTAHLPRGVAAIIPLRPRRRSSRTITLLGGLLVVAVAVIAIVLLFRSGRDLVGGVAPIWPWYWPRS
jgi:hypothetical protein